VEGHVTLGTDGHGDQLEPAEQAQETVLVDSSGGDLHTQGDHRLLAHM
jgi:hypothetical protein